VNELRGERSTYHDKSWKLKKEKFDDRDRCRSCFQDTYPVPNIPRNIKNQLSKPVSLGISVASVVQRGNRVH